MNHSPAWYCEQLNTANVNGLPPLTFAAEAVVEGLDIICRHYINIHILWGLEIVRVMPTGLTVFGFVQSANWNQ